jgi:hypothetical protein
LIDRLCVVQTIQLKSFWPLPPILVGGLLHIFHSASDYRAHRRDRREKTRSPLAGSIDTWSIFCCVYLLCTWFFSTGVGAEWNVLSFSSMSGGVGRFGLCASNATSFLIDPVYSGRSGRPGAAHTHTGNDIKRLDFDSNSPSSASFFFSLSPLFEIEPE